MAKFPFPVTDTDLSLSQYITKIKRTRRMKKIGDGAFAEAYGSKSGRTIIKVGRLDLEGFYECGNTSYLKYVKSVMKCQDNPYAPRIKSVQIFRTKERTYGEVVVEHYMVVEMERLIPLTLNQYPVADLLEKMVLDEDVRQGVQVMIGNKNTANHLKQMVRILRRVTRNGGIDIHGGNIMRRKNGELVITDPVA